MPDDPAAGIKGGEKSCGWCGRTISGDELVCPLCGTEVSDRVSVVPGRHGPRVRERQMYRDYLLPDLTTRFLGRLIDSLVGVPYAVLDLFVFHDSRIGILLGALFLIAYEGTSVAIWGQTVGKRVMGTRVISYRSATLAPSPAQAFTRAAVFASPAVFILVAGTGGSILEQVALAVVGLSILASRDRRGVTDRLAGTIVVDHRTASPG
jgi:uncharacterized RDD family membrane protein YckC